MQSVLWDVCQIFSVYLLEYGLGAVQSYLNYKFTIRLNNGMEDRFYSKLSASNMPCWKTTRATI